MIQDLDVGIFKNLDAEGGAFMLCQECNKRPATLHFTKIVNGEKTEFHICETCAKEKGR